MSILYCIIAIIVISFVISVLVDYNIYRVLKKKYDEEVGYLKSRICELEMLVLYLRDDYKEHMNRYH